MPGTEGIGGEESEKCREASGQFTRGIEVQRQMAAVSIESSKTEVIQREFRKTLRLASRSQKHYESAIQTKCIPLVPPSLFHVGLQYAQVAEMILESPVPRGLTPDQAKTYCRELFGQANRVYAKAVEAWARTLEFARNVGQRGEWVERARRHLAAGKLDETAEVEACLSRSGALAQND